MRPHIVLSSLPVLAITLSGCGSTYLSVKPANHSVNHGIVYHLPKADYEVALKYQLKSCTKDKEMVEVTPVLTTHYRQDPQHTYVINYDQLQSTWKATNATITLNENGTLKGVNADVQDKSAVVMTGAIKALGKVAMLNAGIPLVGEEIVPELEPLVCNDSAIKALAELKKSNKGIKDSSETIEEKTEALNRLMERGKVTQENEAAILKLKEELKEATNAYKTASKLKAESVKFLTEEAVYTFTPKTGATHTEFTPRGTLLAKWFKSGSSRLLSVHAQAVTGSVSANLENSAEAIAADNGVIYRQPATGQLMLCLRVKCVDHQGVTKIKEKDRLMSTDIQVPQLGRLSKLSYRNGAYQDNAISIAFNDAGGLVSYTQTDKSSRAEGVIGNVNDLIDTYGSYTSSVDEYKKEQEEKQAELDAINDTVVKNQTAAAEIKSEAELINAQILLLEAKQKLDAQSMSE